MPRQSVSPSSQEGHAEIRPRNSVGARPDPQAMQSSFDFAVPERLSEDEALKDATLALADSTTLQEMARDFLRTNASGMPRSQLLSRLRRSALTGREAVQYLDGVQLEAAFARSRVAASNFTKALAKPAARDVEDPAAKRKSAAIAARLLLFSPAAASTPAPIPPAKPKARATPKVAPAPAARGGVSFLAIDFETATNRRDSACAVGAVLVENGVVVAEFSSLIRPPWLHVERTHESIHGISASSLTAAPTFSQVFAKLAPLIERADFLVAHNAGFDRTVLESSCRTARLRPPTTPWLCTLQLARALFPLTSFRLPAVAAHLGMALHHHDALSDAQACARIAVHVSVHEKKAFRTAVLRANKTPKSHSAFAAPVVVAASRG